jgi:pimeloyl-ACP methyl ester carboxylesterase
VLEHVDARGATVVGHSMGGMAVQALLVERPEVVEARVAAVVLASTACDDVGGPDALRPVTSRMLASPAFDRALATPRLGRRMLRGVVGRHAHPSHLGAVRDLLVATPVLTRTDLAAAMAALDLSEVLARVELPVTVVVGSKDRLTPPRQSRRLADVVPGASLQVIPGAGHMLSLEAPDELADLIERASLVPPA